MATEEYLVRSKQLIRVIELAVEIFVEYPPADFEQTHIDQFVNTYQDVKLRILEAVEKYQNLKSLSYDEDVVLTYFREADSKATKVFWERIKEEKLPFNSGVGYKKILKIGKIRNLSEYDYVVDTVLVLFQEAKITEEQFKKLSSMIGDYENK